MAGRRRGRILGVALVVVVSLTLADGTPVVAHSCAEPVTVVEGEETPVQVGVTVGDVPTDEVTFQFASSIEISEIVERRGWEVEQDGTSIRYSGGQLDANVCELFDVVIRARDAGTFRVHALQRIGGGGLVEHPPDGEAFFNSDVTTTVVNHQGPPNPLFEQVINVTPGSEESDARGPLLLVSAVAVAAALAFLIPRWKPKRPRAR